MTDATFTPKDGDDDQSKTITFKVGDRDYDAESAATKISSQDEFIETLKAEKSQMEQQLADAEAKATQGSKLDEVLEALKRQQTPDDSGKTTQLDEEALLNKLRTAMKTEAQEEKEAQETAEAERIRTETFAATQAKLLEAFGKDSVDEEISKVLPLDTAMRMASDPALSKVLLKELGLGDKKQAGSPDTSSFSRSKSNNNQEQPTPLHLLSGKARMAEFQRRVAEYSDKDKQQELQLKWSDMNR